MAFSSNGPVTLGPADAKLMVRTGRTGAIAKAGHDLLLEVTKWSGTLDLGAEPVLTLSADATSMRVREGTGGVQALGEEDVANIEQTIDDEVLRGGTIEFRSTGVVVSDGRAHVEGELELLGERRPVSFELTIGDDGRLTATAAIKQSDFGIKPYSALFGTLKVADEVRVMLDGRIPETT